MMKYLNKIWQYQKLLASENRFGGLDQTPSANRGCLFILIYLFIFGLFSYAFGNLCALQVVLFGIAIEYFVATNSKKVYAIVPVSKRFALFNLYLMPIFLSALIYLVLYLFMIIFVLILWICVIIFKVPQGIPPPDVLVNPAGIKTFLFCLMFVLIAIFAVTAISVIRHQKKRIISLISCITFFSVLMLWLKYSLPAAISSSGSLSFTLGFEGILPGFEKMPHIEILLISMAILLLIIAPISVVFAYQEYMREEIKKPS